MEGLNWLRLSAIAALVLGSIYVLLPTALDADPNAAASVQDELSTQESIAKLPYTVVSGDRDAVGQALTDRFLVGGVEIDQVVPEGDRDLTIELGTASIDEVTGLMVPRAPAVVVDADALDGIELTDEQSTVLDDGIEAWLATEAFDESARAGLTALFADLEVDGGVFDGLDQREVTSLTVARETSPPTITAQLAAVDPEPAAKAQVLWVARRPVGLVSPDGRVVTVVPDQAMTVAQVIDLPGRLESRKAKVDKKDQAGETVEDEESDWVVSMLPNTKIPLGLDLQGGSDITLQVELDTAVLNQAKRDLQGLVDNAKEEELTLESVTRQFGDPILEVVSDEELGKLTEFMRKQLGLAYQYTESDGNTHRFEMTDERRAEVADQSMNQVLETLRKRIDATGVKEPSIVRKGAGRINVQLPGLEDPSVALALIQKAAVLEFHMVDMEFEDALLEDILDAAEAALPETLFQDDDQLNRWLHDTGRLDRDRIVLFSEPGNERQFEQVGVWPRKRTNEGEILEASPSVLLERVELTGNDINNAAVGFDNNNQAGVSIDFKPRGGQIFCELTKDAVGKRFAIVLDKVVRSAPNIRERICGGSARIDMGASVSPLDESKALALVLRTGSLDAPVVVASVNQVGATLGADAIRSGATGAIVGASIILVFMALWYRTAGLIADFALVVNVLLVLAALASFGATLTLPGIAGIALTVGMAVDANIIIYERIREELRLGVQPRKAVDVGFDKAAVAVLDANITTAIAGVVLYSYGTGPIKGFAVTLLIGIGTTLVTALFVTRTIMELVTRSSTARLRI